MAKVYHAVKTSTKIMEGALAGLVGGLASALLLVVADALTRGGAWWHTLGLIGSLITGTPEGNVAAPGTSLLVGALIHVLLFVLIGIGFVFYRPLFRRFNINMILAGAIYGFVMWLLIYFFFFNVIKPAITQLANIIVVALAYIVGGAVAGWWANRLRNS